MRGPDTLRRFNSRPPTQLLDLTEPQSRHVQNIFSISLPHCSQTQNSSSQLRGRMTTCFFVPVIDFRVIVVGIVEADDEVDAVKEEEEASLGRSARQIEQLRWRDEGLKNVQSSQAQPS